MSTLIERAAVRSLDDTLVAAGRRWRRRRLWRALAMAAAVLALALAGAAVLVRNSGFDAGTVGDLRWGLMAAAVLLVGGAAGLALSRRPSRAEIARYVEEIDPALDGAVVTAAAPETGRLSPGLADRVASSAAGRAGRATGRRRADVRRDLVAAGVFASSLAVLAGIIGGGPPELRRALSLLVAAPGTSAASALPFISVEPGDINVAERADLAIAATLGNFDTEDAVLVVRRGDWETGREERIGMARETDGSWSARLFDLDTLTFYQVEAGGVLSARHRITVSALPYVSRMDLAYAYPVYTALQPDTVRGGGDISAVAGTTVGVSVETTLPARGGRLVVEGADTIPLVASADGISMDGSITLAASGFYRVELQTDDGRWHPGSLDYVIDVLPDGPPLVRVVRPGRDVQATAIEELYLQAEASDDYGVALLELVMSVNGGEDQVVGLWRSGAPGRRDVSAGHTLYLEEFELQPGDLVAYHARARDANTVTGAGVAQSDIYFVTIRPFTRDYRQGESAGMPGGQGGGEQPSDIVRVQREIVAGTFNATRDRQRTGDTEFRERVATLALSQGRLESEVGELVDRIRQRGFTGGDTTLVQLAATLDTAAAAMRQSEGRLAQRDAQGALGHAREALAYAQRAEALYREVTVNFGGQEGGGGGGGEAPNAEDLADLFSLQTDRLRNQYETLSRSSEQEAAIDREVDELRERLRELAARQQRENEEARRLMDSLARAGAQAAGAGGGGGSSSAASQRALAEEAEREARRLERLSRERQSPALQEGAQRLRDAAEAMRRAAAASRQGDARQAAEALDRLQDAARAVDREDRASVGASLERSAETARRLEEDQRAAAGRAARETNAARQSPTERQRLQQDRLSRAQAVQELEQELDRLAREGRRDRPDAARSAQDAANTIRNERIADKLRYSADRLGILDPESATSLEELIADNLAGVRERVERAGREAAAADARDPGAALDRARSLVQGLESLRDRTAGQPGEGSAQTIGEPRDSAEGTGGDRQQGAQGGEGSREGRGQLGDGQPGGGQPGAGGGDRAGAGLNPAGGSGGVQRGGGVPGERERSRELAERRAEAEQLRQELAGQGVDVSDVDRLLEQMRELERARVWDNSAEVRQLQSAIVDGWKLVEFRLLRAALAAEGTPPLERRLEAIPPEYRDVVERYYRALAGREDPPPE